MAPGMVEHFLPECSPSHLKAHVEFCGSPMWINELRDFAW